MKKIIFTSILAVLALLLQAVDGQARGDRGYAGGGLRMGSVSHAGYYPRGYYGRGYYYDDGGVTNTIVGYNYAQPAEGDGADRHAEVAPAGPQVDPSIQQGMKRPVALGATTSQLPRGYHRYVWNQTDYYYCAGGAWYVAGTGNGAGYVATNPPPGITVVQLTGQAQHVVVGGKTRYLCAGIYYKAIWTDGHATYMVVKAP